MATPKKEKVASTQHYLNIADIRENVLVLRNGELRQILEVQALNFALKSEQEQAAIIYQYQSFLNSLQFPLQLLVQSRQLDLSSYMADLRNQVGNTANPLIKNQIVDYLEFISRLISLGSIMEKHFYAVVPYSSQTIRNQNLLSMVLRRETVAVEEDQFNEARVKLADRVELVRGGLASIGLAVNVLPREAMIRLLHSTYNPIDAGEVRLEPTTKT